LLNSAAKPLVVPRIRHVTSVAASPDGASSKNTWLVAFHGCSNCSRTSIRSGVDETISMLPLPALRLPSQAYFEPTPDSAPE
jgi:hypothetical protein